MREEQLYLTAKKIVKKKKRFYRHLGAYIAVNIVFFFVVLFDSGTLEWLFPASFWGIGLFIHYINVFGFPGRNGLGGSEWEQQEIEKEMDKMRTDHDIESHETISNEELELKDFQAIRKNWNDADLV